MLRAEEAAAAAQQTADEARTRADEEAARKRAEEDDRAYAAFLANHAEKVRREARRRAEDECDRCLRDVGSRVPPVSGTEMDATRRQAFAAREAAYKAADDACEEGLRQGREALAAANDAALRTYMDAADAAALEHEQQRAAAGRAREDAIQAANQEFVRAIMQRSRGRGDRACLRAGEAGHRAARRGGKTGDLPAGCAAGSAPGYARADGELIVLVGRDQWARSPKSVIPRRWRFRYRPLREMPSVDAAADMCPPACRSARLIISVSRYAVACSSD